MLDPENKGSAKESGEPSQRRKLIEATYESVWEHSGIFKPFRPILEAEWAGMKKGWFLCLVVCGVFAYLMHLADKTYYSSKIEDADSLSKSNSIAVQIISGNYQSLDSRYRDKESDNVKLHSDLNAANAELGRFQRFAAGLYTNELPQKQLDLLFSQLQSVSNLLGTISSDAPMFHTYLNEKLLTGSDIIRLDKDRRVFLKVENVGKRTAEKPTVHFYAKLDTTNFVGDARWARKAGYGIVEMPEMNTWIYEPKDLLLPVRGVLSLTEFHISTNFSGVIPIRIDVYSSTSKTYTYAAALIIE